MRRASEEVRDILPGQLLEAHPQLNCSKPNERESRDPSISGLRIKEPRAQSIRLKVDSFQRSKSRKSKDGMGKRTTNTLKDQNTSVSVCIWERGKTDKSVRIDGTRQMMQVVVGARSPVPTQKRYNIADKRIPRKQMVCITDITGATQIAFPAHTSIKHEEESHAETHKTATGEIVHDLGSAEGIGQLSGTLVRIRGKEAVTRKALLSASRPTGSGCIRWIDEDGGVLTHRSCHVAQELRRRHVKHLLNEHGESGIIP